jgi:hypothetical protein
MAVDGCRRTLDVLERTLAGRATERDRQHVPGCAGCARAVASLPAFERRLGEIARSIAAEPLPVDVLDGPAPVAAAGVVGGRASGAMRLAVAGLGLVAFVLLAVPILQPGQGPGVAPVASPTPAPRLRSEAAIVASLTELGLRCSPTVFDPVASPPTTGSLCTPEAPKSGITLFAAVELDTTGVPRIVSAKAKREVGVDAAARADVETTLAAVAGVGIADPADAASATEWVRAQMPVGDEFVNASTTLGGLDLQLQFSTSLGYLLLVDAPRP